MSGPPEHRKESLVACAKQGHLNLDKHYDGEPN